MSEKLASVGGMYKAVLQAADLQQEFDKLATISDAGNL